MPSLKNVDELDCEESFSPVQHLHPESEHVVCLGEKSSHTRIVGPLFDVSCVCGRSGPRTMRSDNLFPSRGSRAIRSVVWLARHLSLPPRTTRLPP